jgi:hypothetical protein
MSLPEDIASLSREELLALVGEQQQQIAGLQAQLEEATTVVEKLRAEVTELQRSSKRQATPFSKGNRAQQPKRPGRKPGKGTFSSGKEAASRSPPPLRTGYESFPSSGSSRWAFMLPSSVGCVSDSGRLRGAIASSLPPRSHLP